MRLRLRQLYLLFYSCLQPLYEHKVAGGHYGAAYEPGGHFCIRDSTEADDRRNHKGKHASDDKLHTGPHHGDDLTLKALDAHTEAHDGCLCPDEQTFNSEHGRRHEDNIAVFRIGDKLCDLSPEEEYDEICEHVDGGA